jgi:hypothetical protein
VGRKRKITRRRLVPADVLASVSFIDSVFLEMHKKLQPSMYGALLDALYQGADRSVKRLHMKRLPYGDGSQYHYRLTLHQPTKDCVQMLVEIQQADPKIFSIVEVHVALDLTAETYLECENLQDYFLEMLLPTSRPNGPVVETGRTAYYNRNIGVGAEVAIYSDRPSKVLGGPCAHLEWRTRGAKVLAKEELRYPQQLLELDHLKFWKKRLTLWHSPQDAAVLRSILRMQAKRGESPSADRATRLLNVLRRQSLSVRGVLVGHNYYLNLLDTAGVHARPRRLFKPEPVLWALPEPANSLWCPKSPSH